MTSNYFVQVVLISFAVVVIHDVGRIPVLTNTDLSDVVQHAEDKIGLRLWG